VYLIHTASHTILKQPKVILPLVGAGSGETSYKRGGGSFPSDDGTAKTVLLGNTKYQQKMDNAD